MRTVLRYSTLVALTLSFVAAGAPTAHAADPVPPAATTASAPSPPSDPIHDAERERIVGKGRRLVTTGSVFSLVGLGGVIAAAVFSVQGNTGGAIVASAGAVLAAGTGLALIVPGRRRVQTPERYMKTQSAAIGVAPVLTRRTQGVALSIRF